MKMRFFYKGGKPLTKGGNPHTGSDPTCNRTRKINLDHIMLKPTMNRLVISLLNKETYKWSTTGRRRRRRERWVMVEDVSSSRSKKARTRGREQRVRNLREKACPSTSFCLHYIGSDLMGFFFNNFFLEFRSLWWLCWRPS